MGEDVAAAPVSALIVVVVEEDQRAIAGHQLGPARPEAPKLGEVGVVEVLGEPAAVVELGDQTVGEILPAFDGLAEGLDDLLIDQGLATGAGEDGGNVVGRHVLGRVDAEPGDPEAQEVPKITGDGALHPRRTRIEIRQRDQVAVFDAVAIAIVVADVLAAVVEIVGAEVRVLVVVVGAAGAARSP